MESLENQKKCNFKTFSIGLIIAISLFNVSNVLAVEWLKTEISSSSSNSTPFAPSTSTWTITSTKTGLASANDSVTFFNTACQKGGSIEWIYAAPTQGTLGIMIRASSTSDSAYAFLGFNGSGCVFLSRTATGLNKLISRSIPSIGTGDSLKIELVGNTAFVLTKEGSDPEDEWVRRWGVDLYDAPALVLGAGLRDGSGDLITSCKMGVVSAATANPLNFTASESALKLIQKSNGARWQRLIEPIAGETEGKPGKVVKGTSYPVLTPDPASLWTVVENSSYASGDYISYLAENSSSISELAEYCIDVTLPAHKDVDIYGRWADVAQTLDPSFNIYCSALYDQPTAPEFSKTVTLPSDGGTWVYLGRVRADGTTPDNHAITISAKSYINQFVPSTFSEGTFAFDGFLVVAVDEAEDNNDDGVPDYLASYGTGPVWGDEDGDGWSNYWESMLGFQFAEPFSLIKDGLAGWRTVVVSRNAGQGGASLGAPIFAAYDHWIPTMEAKVVYQDDNSPVEGYCVNFHNSTNQDESDAPWTLLTPSRSSAPALPTAIGVDETGIAESLVKSPTDVNGIARCEAWVVERGDGTELASIGIDSTHKWYIKPYRNFAPGPLDASSANMKLSRTGVTVMPSVSNYIVGPPLVLKGDALAEGRIGSPFLPGIPSTSGYVQLHKWSSARAEWQISRTIPPPGSPASPQFGKNLQFSNIGGTDYIVISGAYAVYFFPKVDGQYSTTPVDSMTITSTDNIMELAACPNRIAFTIGAYGENRGGVKVYRWESSAWTSVQILAPTGAGHSDRFGTALNFSSDGSRLAVGAPSDMEWHLNPANQPHNEYSYVEIYGVIGYDPETNYEMTGVIGYEEVVTWVEPEPPVAPAVYVYLFSGTLSEWVLEQKIAKTATTNAFGSSVLFRSDSALIVGAPSFIDPTYYTFTNGYIEAFARSGSVWTSSDTLNRSSCYFGKKLSGGADYFYADARYIVGDGSTHHLGFLTALKLVAGDFEAIQEVYPGGSGDLYENNVGSFSADGDTIVLRTLSSLHEYAWVPYVSAVATYGNAASLQVHDADIGRLSGFTETLSLTLLEPATSPFEIAHVSGQNYAMSIKSGSSTLLSAMAGTVAWTKFSATDRAGDIYQEVKGVRIVGSVPSTPSGFTAEVANQNTVRLSWSPPSVLPTAYILECANLSYLQWATTPEEENAYFAEIARIIGSASAFEERYAGEYMPYGLVYRLRAENNEGVSSVASVTLLVDADENTLPDWWEALYPGSDPEGDTDLDGWSDWSEFYHGTHPGIGDTDGDGVKDSLDSDAKDRNYNTVGMLVHSDLAQHP